MLELLCFIQLMYQAKKMSFLMSKCQFYGIYINKIRQNVIFRTKIMTFFAKFSSLDFQIWENLVFFGIVITVSNYQ